MASTESHISNDLDLRELAYIVYAQVVTFVYFYHGNSFELMHHSTRQTKARSRTSLPALRLENYSLTENEDGRIRCLVIKIVCALAACLANV